MKTIPLTKGQVALVDTVDYERVRRYRWHAKWNPGTRSYYAYTGVGATTSMASFIMGAALVDHINHDTLNNCRSNLRIATKSQNGANSRRYRNNTSGYTGVSWNGNRWMAYIRFRGRRIFLGYFKTKEGAKRVRNRFARIYFGEFANE